MSYMGFTKLMSRYLDLINQPMILEIGVDRGQTALPLLHNLSCTCKEGFRWIGVDVQFDDTFCNQVLQMIGLAGGMIVNLEKLNFRGSSWNTAFLKMNSLDAMSKMVDIGLRFDLIMIDGDHNYATVFEELKLAKQLSHESTIIIADDFRGKWAREDCFYKDRPTHADNELLHRPTHVLEDEDSKTSKNKKGVRTAIEDWIISEKDYTLLDIQKDAVVIFRKNIHVEFFDQTDTISDAGLILHSNSKDNYRFKKHVAHSLNKGESIKHY